MISATTLKPSSDNIQLSRSKAEGYRVNPGLNFIFPMKLYRQLIRCLPSCLEWKDLR